MPDTGVRKPRPAGPGSAGDPPAHGREEEEEEDDGEQAGRRTVAPQSVGVMRKAAIKAGGGGGLGRSRMGMLKGSGMSHEDDKNPNKRWGAGAGTDGRLRYYQELLVLKTSKAPQKITFGKLFLWANMALCPSCGSWPQMGRDVMEEQQRQVLVLLAFPALAQSPAGNWRVSEWFGEAPGNFKILPGEGERVLNI